MNLKYGVTANSDVQRANPPNQVYSSFNRIISRYQSGTWILNIVIVIIKMDCYFLNYNSTSCPYFWITAPAFLSVLPPPLFLLLQRMPPPTRPTIDAIIQYLCYATMMIVVAVSPVLFCHLLDAFSINIIKQKCSMCFGPS